MKSAPAAKAILCLLLLGALLTSGCAYTTVAVREKIPAFGPLVPAGLEAVLVPIQDKRTWPERVSAASIPNVRIFAPQMTESIQKGLVQKGLFKKLVPFQAPEAKDHPNSLRIDIKGFLVTNLGTNVWVVPHLLINGALLPVFTGTLVGTQGKVDMGGYLTPSTRMGTTIQARVIYREAGYELPVLERDYLVKLELDEVSERSLINSISKGETYGVEIGREEGEKTMDLFIETMARDPRWGFLPQFRRLAKAEAQLSGDAPQTQRLAAVSGLLDLLKPLAYTEEEVKVLRDGYLEAKPRATITNDMRAQWLELASIKDLPKDQFITEEQAEAFFKDPSLPKAEVESILAEKVLGLIAQALVMKPQSPQVAKDQAKLLDQLVAKLKGQPRLQSLLLLQADKMIEGDWAPMKEVLQAMNAPLVDKYLKKRS